MKIRLNRKRVFVIAAVLAVAMLLLCAFFALSRWEQAHNKLPAAAKTEEQSEELYADEDRPVIFKDGKRYVLRRELETVLLIGLDKFADDTSAAEADYFNREQADFCLLLILDHGRKTCTALHINRDTMTDVHILSVDGKDAGTRYEQLALSHTYGSGGSESCENTARAVSELLYGAPVDHYASLTMDAVSEVNDRLGGVSVKIMDDFTMSDAAMQENKALILTGEQALLYVRARSGMEDSTNLRRMERQQQYMQALLDTAVERQHEGSEIIVNTIFAISPYLVSDCTVDEMQSIANSMLSYENEGIRVLAGEAVVGREFMEYYADEAALQSLVLELFYEEAQP